MNRSSIQKANMTAQLKTYEFIAIAIHDFTRVHRTAQVAVENKDDRGEQSDEDTDQEVGEHDGQDRHDKRDKLATTLTPHTDEQFGAGEFKSGYDENRCQRCERNLIE